MDLKLFQLDAFTDTLFAGNPAAVCPLAAWLDETTMQSIAAENNLSETAFFVGGAGRYELRWFTPLAEVDLCGHATLATAQVIFDHLEPNLETIYFQTRSGELVVCRDGALLTMDFPTQPPQPCEVPEALLAALGVEPVEVLASADYLVVLERAEQIRALQPDLALLKQLPLRGVIVTAPGEDCDFVSRFFAPKVGIDEDPVTGSAHCVLTPYWAGRLNRQVLVARQLSSRGGKLRCRLRGDRVALSGSCVPYFEGTIRIPG